MSGMPPELRQRIDDALARADLVGIVGRTVKLRRSGREYLGLCPFHQETTPSFTVAPEKRFWHCFGCGAHGDALRFLREAQGLSFADALAALDGQAVAASPGHVAERRASVRQDRADVDLVSSMEAAVMVWRMARPAAGTIVEAWYRHRGIEPHATGILGVERFLARCPVALWPKGGAPRQTLPAKLAPICRIEGGRGARMVVQQGVHVTFLRPDGRGKADVSPARKIWGEAALGCVPVPPPMWEDWRDGAWLDEPGELIAGEGIESTLSLVERECRIDMVRGGLAALSLGNLQGHPLEEGPKIDGAPSLQMWNLRPDPERAAFTVPDGGAVAVGVDADMKGLRNRRVQDRPRGKPVRRDLSGEERTTICAQLSALAWKRAGASRVRVLRPHAGCDFNDEAMGAAS